MSSVAISAVVVYVVQVQYLDEFFLKEDDARRKVEELRRESRKLYPNLEDDSKVT